jgi:hypothetical protein
MLMHDRHAAVLVFLCSIGLGAVVVETLSANDPSSLFMWGVLVWLVSLMFVLAMAMRSEVGAQALTRRNGS